MERAVIDISKGIPIGLIANEIMTNSFKYAFEDIDHPQLSIELRRNRRQVTLIFRDNGSAYDPDTTEEGMGLELIRDLSEQISADLKLKLDEGVRFEISFMIQ